MPVFATQSRAIQPVQPQSHYSTWAEVLPGLVWGMSKMVNIHWQNNLPKRPVLGGGVAGMGTDDEAMGVGASKGLARPERNLSIV